MESSAHVLAHADHCPVLPRLGGMARPDGVVIASERYWAMARRDGVLIEREVRRPRALLVRLPMVRGLVRLGFAFAPLRVDGVTRRRDRFVLALALAVPFGLAFLPAALELPAGLTLTAALLAWIFKGRTLNLHGAEHRAIAAAEERSLCATWEGRTSPSRFSPRCGTNFAALTVCITAALYFLVPAAREAATAFPIQLGTLGFTMELWFAIQSSRVRLLRVLLAPGLALQRLTTREPTLPETQLALLAAASVLRRELSAPASYQRR